MFTDVADSTRLKQPDNLGAVLYAQLARKHDALFRQIAVSIPGADVLKDVGDGFMATFPSASDAVRAALRFQFVINNDSDFSPSPSRLPFRVRIGVHQGEVSVLDLDIQGKPKLVGSAADMTARIQSLALPGQILVSRAAFDNARQYVGDHPVCSGGTACPLLSWDAHGFYRFKGIPDSQEVFEVGAQGSAPCKAPVDTEKAHYVGSPDDEAMRGWRPALGQEIPRRTSWVLEKKIGEGSFGEVWLASHKKTREWRVFKFCFSSDRLRSFKRELTLFRLLRDALGDRTDIARLYEVSLESPPYMLESQYESGGNLLDWFEKHGGINTLPLAQRIELLVKIADAVAAAHSVGVLHKDLKPSNVLIREVGGKPEPILSDFGIGILTDREQLKRRAITEVSFTQVTENDSSRTGTQIYAPPELLVGKAFTVQGDVFAMGVMLYQLVIGDLGRPLAAGWEREITDPLLREEIAACADGDPSRRVASAAEVAARLRGLETKRLEQRRRLEQEASSRAWARRTRIAVAVSVLLAALLLSGGITAFFYIAQLKAQRAIAEKARESETAAKELAVANEREAKLRLADGLMSQGDALAETGQWLAAKGDYQEAYDTFVSIKVSLIKALAAMSVANATSPPALLTFSGHTGFVTCIAFSPDGRSALSGSLDKTLKLWNLATGKEIRTFKAQNRVRKVAVSPDGHTALSGDDDFALKLWDMDTGKEIRTLSGQNGHIYCVAISPDGRTALSGSGYNVLKLWDLVTGKEIRILDGHRTYVFSVAFSPDGRTALSGSADNTLKLWDLSTGKEVRTFKGHTDDVESVAFSPDGRTAVSASADNTLKLWDLQSGKEIRTFAGYAKIDPSIAITSDQFTSVAFSPDGRFVLSGSRDKTLKLWDLASGKVIESFEGHNRSNGCVAISPDGRFALSGDTDNTVKLWDLAAGNDNRTFAENIAVGHVAISPDGRSALCGSTDNTVKLWDLATGKEVRSLKGHADFVESVAFSPNGRSALSASGDKTLKLWDLSSGKEIRTLIGHTGAVWSVAVSPDGRTALSGGYQDTLRLWDLQTGKEIRILPLPADNAYYDGITDVAFSADGRTAFSSNRGSSFDVWDLATGKHLRTLAGPTSGYFSGGAFSPDCQTAVSGDGDSSLILWNLASGTFRTLAGQNSYISRVTFSPDGRTVLSGGYDGALKIWDTEIGGESRTLTGHAGMVRGLAFSPDGLSTLSCGEEKTLKLWDFSRAKAYLDFEPKVQQAQAALQTNSDDAAALAVLGEWYAFRGVNDWAVEFLEQARAGGTNINPLTLARCYWELSDDLPPRTKLTRADCLSAASREFSAALAASKDEQEKFHLRLCLSAIQQAVVQSAAEPTTTKP